MRARGSRTSSTRDRIVIALAIAGVACRSPNPATPKPFDVKPLAAEIYAELAELATLAERTRGACPEMAAGMKPIVARMQATAASVARAKQDPDIAKRLTTELRTYDGRTAGLTDAVAANLATCRGDREVMLIVDAIPTM